MSREPTIHDLDGLEFGSSLPNIFQQTDSALEEHGHNMNTQFVDRPGGQELLNAVRAAQHQDFSIARDSLGLRQRALDSVGHQREGRVAHRINIALATVRQDQDGNREWRIAPIAHAFVGHPPPDDPRSR
jgi:hypothetical protein